MLNRISALILAGVLALGASGCTDPDKATSALQGAGYKDVQITGYRFFGCSDSDTFRTGFNATGPSGVRVSGVVCGGWLKGSTIRMD